jgi:hypothetical protein
MPTRLTVKAVERSTFVVTAAFTDETGAAVVPNSGLTWSLYKRVGAPPVDTIVNSRNQVAIASASSVSIVLSGADLALTAGQTRARYVLIEGTYTSTLGTLPIKDEVVFEIVDLVGVT